MLDWLSMELNIVRAALANIGSCVCSLCWSSYSRPRHTDVPATCVRPLRLLVHKDILKWTTFASVSIFLSSLAAVPTIPDVPTVGTFGRTTTARLCCLSCIPNAGIATNCFWCCHGTAGHFYVTAQFLKYSVKNMATMVVNVHWLWLYGVRCSFYSKVEKQYLSSWYVLLFLSTQYVHQGAAHAVELKAQHVAVVSVMEQDTRCLDCIL